jgi:hypothetical protein
MCPFPIILLDSSGNQAAYSLSHPRTGVYTVEKILRFNKAKKF